MIVLRKWLLNTKNTRSPFIRPPLNSPGETLVNKLDDLLMNLSVLMISPIMFLIIMVWVFLTSDSQVSLSIRVSELLMIYIPVLLFGSLKEK